MFIRKIHIFNTLAICKDVLFHGISCLCEAGRFPGRVEHGLGRATEAQQILRGTFEPEDLRCGNYLENGIYPRLSVENISAIYDATPNFVLRDYSPVRQVG